MFWSQADRAANWENRVNRSNSSLEIAGTFLLSDWTLCFVVCETHHGELVGQEMH